MAGFSPPKCPASLCRCPLVYRKIQRPEAVREHGEYILVIIDHKDVQCHGLLASLPHATQRLGGTLGLLH